MKNIIMFILLALLGMAQATAQEYEYVPFVREGVKWVYYSFNYEYYPGYPAPSGTVFHTLELKGDTVINGKTYKAMHCYSGDTINEENDTVPAYLREQDKVVYGIFSAFSPSEEYTIYDFNDPATFLRHNAPIYAQMEEIENPYKFADTITVNGHKVKRHAFSLWSCGDFCLIEGIGYDGLYDGYTLFYLNPRFNDSPFDCLSHVIEDGKVIYRSEREKEYGKSPYLPIVRTGVTWVNERVIVNDGDTTSFYYCYTFNLDGSGNHDYCYYSSKDPSHPCADSLVSYVHNYGNELKFYDNTMLNACIDKGTNMIDLKFENLLYTFHKSDISYYNLRNYYIEYQNGDWLNRENFIEVEPLTIEGVTCSRYAYINEQGDTAAYVVEGIGFDSRNMGDLLTPFTREPDPNANHQEWCGLSHVVKDGQIIYKGMRYTPDNMTGLDEVVADQRPRQYDDNYYNLMGQPVGKALPTTPGIYIHHGNKIVVNY